MKLSIVATIYKSTAYIAEFHRRVGATARDLVGDDYEIVLVNDGSPDDSLRVATQLLDHDPRLRVLDLSRNFGHHRAMMCGLQHALGDYVFLTDIDLEEPPEALIDFWRAMDMDVETDVVVGRLQEKAGPPLKRIASALFYRVFNALSDVYVSNRIIVSRLMKRPYVNALIEYQEREIFFPAIWSDAGFRQKEIPATKTYDGSSTYTLQKRLVMAVDAITSFSSKPLKYIFFLGLLFSFGSTLFIIYLILRKLLVGQMIPGWTSLMAVSFLIGGIIIFSLGVVGIYVAKIYTEVKARPSSIVRKIYAYSDRHTQTGATPKKEVVNG